MRIYLAGPIKGLTYDESTSWRSQFQQLVGPDIHCLSPMRGKEYLQKETVLEGTYPQYVMSCSRGIMTRDFFDCTRADAVVANFLGAQVVSIGTVMECAWTYQARIPLITIIEQSGNPHDHPMMQEAFGFRVTTLEEAAHVARVVLWPVPSLKALEC